MRNLFIIFCTLVAAIVPVLVRAEPSAEISDKAFKLYKKSGFVSNDLIKESMANIAARQEDCSKPLNEIALDNLTSDQKSSLNPSFINDFAVVSAFGSARRLWQRFNKGTTDEEQAIFFLMVNLGGALRYRSEVCSLPPNERGVGSMSASSESGAPRAPRAAIAESAEVTSNASKEMSASSLNVRRVVGIDEREGEIVGEGSPDGRFSQLRIGMVIGQVLAHAGQPDDQSFRAMAKSVTPLSFGPDQYRVEYAYKGVGKLTFSSSGGGLGIKEMNLVRITFDTLETGNL